MSAMAVLPLIGLTSATAAPLRDAAPVADCATAFPIDELTDNQAVDGLTVSRGTTPEAFTGTVLGVLKDGIAPGVDMVIADLDSPAIEAAGGIWQGMSGSPVYAADGRLIGAVSYGLAYGSSPVAGITPFADMDDYLGDAGRPGRVALPQGLARKVADRSGVSTADAQNGLRQLPMPVGVTGVSARVLKASAGARPYLPTSTYALGRADAAAEPSPDTIVAGGNIAASLSYGDITQAGVGTATSVCNGDVVGFGHPFLFAGRTTLSLHPADALYIQEDPLGVPFKVANIGAPAGVVDEDHLTGITGTFGDAPDAATVQSDVTYRDRSRVGTSYVSVDEALPDVAFYEHINNLARVIDAEAPGSQTQSWVIDGTDTDGSAFELTFANRYASDSDNLYAGAFDLSDVLYQLTSTPGVDVTSVSNEVVASDDATTYTVGAVEQRRGGEWVKVNRKNPVRAHAGVPLTLRARLDGGSAPQYFPFRFVVPKKAAGGQGSISLFGNGGGDEFYYEDGEFKAARSGVDAVAAQLAKRVRNDQLSAQFFLRGRHLRVRETKVSDPFDKVVSGYRDVRVVVAKK